MPYKTVPGRSALFNTRYLIFVSLYASLSSRKHSPHHLDRKGRFPTEYGKTYKYFSDSANHTSFFDADRLKSP